MTAVSQGGVPAGLQGLCSGGKVCSCLTLQGWGTASTPGDLGEVPPTPALLRSAAKPCRDRGGR